MDKINHFIEKYSNDITIIEYIKQSPLIDGNNEKLLDIAKNIQTEPINCEI